MSDLLPLDDALALMARVMKPVTGEEARPLADALHAVTAQAISAPYALPPFTNTGVDGYAFRHDGQMNVYTLVGASFAGAPFGQGKLLPCQAVRIATGAVLPDGADTVAMQEHCTVNGTQVTLHTLPPISANIRAAGTDIRAGDAVLPAGHRLRPQDIALLGALGFTTVPTKRRLRIALASTGQELAAFGSTLAPGQIIDTNSLMLRQLLASDDVVITQLPPLPDAFDASCDALKAAASNHDLILTTGGVSVGDRDYIRPAVAELGTIHFWRLAIRPGKPVLFGQIGGCLTLGLPGNPVSALVTACLVLKPLLAVLRGGNALLPPAFALPLAVDFPKNVPLRCFPRARLVSQNGTLAVMPHHDQSSNLFTSLTHSDGLLDLPLDAGDYHTGNSVLFRPYQGLF